MSITLLFCALFLLMTLGLLVASLVRRDALLLLSALGAMLIAGVWAAGYGALNSG
jgi:hypothetical protein